MKKDNIVVVIQTVAHYYKIPVNNDTIERYLTNHYLFPSLEVVCDAFNEWDIDFEIYRMNSTDIKNIDYPFIAHLNIEDGQIIFVYDMIDGYISYSDSYKVKKKVSIEKFLERCSGIIIRIKPGIDSGEKDYIKKKQSRIVTKLIIPTCFLISILIPIFLFNDEISNLFSLVFSVIIFTKLFGFTLSLFIVLKELKIYNKFTKNICNLNSRFDCDAIIKTPASVFYGWISWGDIGIIYFISCIYTLFIMPDYSGLNVLLIISLLSIFFPFYSIYYQLIKIKKICPFCMLVQLTLVIEFILLLIIGKFEIPRFREILLVSIVFMANGIFILLLKAFYIQKNKIIENTDMLFFFKHNPQIFSTLLKQGSKFNFQINEYSFFYGCHNNPVIITAFLSLSCKSCSESFHHLKKLIRKNDKVSLNIIFSVDNDEYFAVINLLYNILHTQESDDAYIALENWYSKSISQTEWQNEFNKLNSINFMIELESLNKKLYIDSKVSEVPKLFINGYQLPKVYDIFEINDLLLQEDNI
ncbi:MAG: vitamin K epoxide reductase family protein [Bacteroidales bacterium]|jgi:uncharacterized membrane protein|nr:vitamin K epoxide reductase family protein [Bacteroidales bacterium]